MPQRRGRIFPVLHGSSLFSHTLIYTTEFESKEFFLQKKKKYININWYKYFESLIIKKFWSVSTRLSEHLIALNHLHKLESASISIYIFKKKKNAIYIIV